MKFEIEGDTKAILKAFEAHSKLFNDEYNEQIKKARETLGTLGMAKSADAFPDELFMMFWEENGKVIIRIPTYTPKIIKALGRHKRLADNFKGFLQGQGVRVNNVKYAGD
jgi:hypothetical protein